MSVRGDIAYMYVISSDKDASLGALATESGLSRINLYSSTRLTGTAARGRLSIDGAGLFR